MTARVLVVQNEDGDPPGLVGQWLAEIDVDLDVLRPFAGDVVPSSVPEGYSAVIAFGGAMGAIDDDDYPWLPAERDLLGDATTRDIPVLGICLGGQMLAAATGGQVGRADTIEIGVSTISVSADARDDAVFGALAGQDVPAAQWHQDWVSQLPHDAVVLASNDACPVQAFRVGANAYGVQFHPEVDGATFASWRGVADEAADRSGLDTDAAAVEVAASEQALIRTWRPVVHRWGRLVTQHS